MVPVDQMNGFGADDAIDLVFAYHHRFALDDPVINAANCGKAQKPLLGNIGDNKANFVHMRIEHHLVAGMLCAFFKAMTSPRGVTSYSQ